MIHKYGLRADEIIVDNFAGGGGASLGIAQALGRGPDIAVNHDREAIAMHQANHPETRHYCEDVWNIDPIEATGGRPVGLAWFSPDCRHFSKAKGGKPVKKNIRGLAWVVIRWAKKVAPRVIILENVEEFQEWGPLLPDNTPCPMRKGITFRRWKKQLENLGYRVECRELRACEYGAPTIRRRLFLVARRDHLPIVWPVRTHGPGHSTPYRTAAECIDWTLPCPSIFERKRPLADATLRRIAKGVRRYVIESGDPFIVTCNHGKPGFRGQGVDEPMKTITASRDAHGLVMPYVMTNTTGHAGAPADEPLRTITTGGHHALISPTLIQTGYGERPGQAPRVPGLDKPLGTVVAGGQKHALVAAFMAQHNTGMTGRAAAAPLSTITERGTQQQLVTSHMVKLYGTCRHGQDNRQPMPTITAAGNHIGEVRAFLVKYYGTDQDPKLHEPLHTVTSKDRFGLVTVKGEDYVIADIGMRMLQPRELYRAQGFPDDYIIDPIVNGKPLTKTSQVRMCGNSVCPPVAKALIRANLFVDNVSQEGAA